jgi:endonuclease YncB( thermonuclease family)
MLRDLPVVCRITGMDGLGRPYAICQANGAELNSAVIAAGWARADTANPELKSAEQAARAARRGVWAIE